MNVFVDTHVLVWRFLEPSKLSPAQAGFFQREETGFLVPTIVLLEIQYLKEIGRIEVNLGDFLLTLKSEDKFRLIPFDEMVMLESLNLATTRDPFDRIILAHALATATKILTKDRWMKKTAPQLVVA